MRSMKVVLAATAAALVGGAAMAQNVAPDFGAMARMRQGKAYSGIKQQKFLEQFSKDGRAWIEAETQRQIDNPRPLLDVALDIDKTLVEDAQDLKRRYRVHPLDVTRAVAMTIMQTARDAAAEAVAAAEKRGDAAALAAAKTRLEMAEANLDATVRVQSDASRALAQL